MTDAPNQPDARGHRPDAPADPSGAAQAAAAGEAASSPPFSHRRMRRDVWLDLAARRGLAGLALAGLLAVLLFDLSDSLLGLAIVVALAVAWVALGTVSANVLRLLPEVTVLIGRDPATAEAQLQQLLRQRPLLRWVRLLLYHRLAALRHRQRRFAESAAICRAVLAQPLGPARRQRASLLLMLAESCLQCHDLLGAYHALTGLHGEPLALAERLQRLAIQTRYEVLCGHDRAALTGVRQKLLMAELMPAEHCGAMHAMLTASAKRSGRDELADWLWRRSELLVGREQLDRLVRGAFAVGVVGPPEP